MDLIDREQAIEKVNAVADEWAIDMLGGSYWAGFCLGTEIAINTISNEVPSAEKTGNWIKHDNELLGLTYECSVCHIEGMLHSPYCPICGARMVHDED